LGEGERDSRPAKSVAGPRLAILHSLKKTKPEWGGREKRKLSETKIFLEFEKERRLTIRERGKRKVFKEGVQTVRPGSSQNSKEKGKTRDWG